ncbi:MAG: 5-(carboxyamino)imidazole ribonucleotide mutase [Thermoplasmata archaeon]|nr:5-(carboxyamino)imidazole ribonucleotide mutase [Thermoplasmata archaeon]
MEMVDVCVIAGSISDIEVIKKCVSILKELEISHEVHIASAHKSPELVEQIVGNSSAKVFIAIAGLSAALPGVVASKTLKPVIGVPCSGKISLDAILSVVQMPPGMPVGCVSLDGGANAALLAARILALNNEKIAERLEEYRDKLVEEMKKQDKKIEEELNH